jgi:membrane protein YqaA with SNARE-associated domain
MQHFVSDAWEWIKAWMRSPYAPLFLFVYSFIETLITLIPIDPFAIAAMAADKKRAYSTALFIVLGSLCGALTGYAIGNVAFSEWGPVLLGSGGVQHAIERLAHIWSSHEFLITFTTAFVPIPKTPTIIAAGFLSGSIVTFIGAWITGRTLHFIAEAIIVRTATSENLSRETRLLSAAALCFFFAVIGYLVFVESGLSL